MKSIIEQLEELKNGDKYHDCGIDKAIAIVKAGRDKYKKRMCLGSNNRNPDKCNCENCKIHDEMVEEVTKWIIVNLDKRLTDVIKYAIEAGRKAERLSGISEINCCEETDCEFYPETLRRLKKAKQEGWNKCIEAVEKLVSEHPLSGSTEVVMAEEDWQALKKQKPPTKVRSKEGV